ncbi:MAG: cytochrome c oxidase subunit II [Candidatus Limnocylindrales bacterium]
MTQVAVGVAFVLMAGALGAVFLTVALEARTQAWEVVYQQGGQVRRWWFIGLLIFSVVVFILSMTWLPYQFVRNAELGPAATTVQVTAHQFAFDLSSKSLPLGQTIEFDVGSTDVNHGFAIYGPDGRIVGQTQAMPGFTNKLVMQFTTPGTYTLHCDELCGAGHPFMTGTFTVGSSAGGSSSAACGGGGCSPGACGGGSCGPAACGGGSCA